MVVLFNLQLRRPWLTPNWSLAPVDESPNSSLLVQLEGNWITVPLLSEGPWEGESFPWEVKQPVCFWLVERERVGLVFPSKGREGWVNLDFKKFWSECWRCFSYPFQHSRERSENQGCQLILLHDTMNSTSSHPSPACFLQLSPKELQRLQSLILLMVTMTLIN